MGTPEDMREFPRYPLRSQVRLTDAEGRVHEVYTRDLSHGGLFLMLKSDQLPGVDSQVEVEAMDIEDPLPQPAVVVRSEPGKGIAIRFI